MKPALTLRRSTPISTSNMTKRNIITLPDPLLRGSSAPVERVDDELRELIDDMLETMYDAPGIGLAAVQLAIPRRVIVMDVEARRGLRRAFSPLLAALRHIDDDDNQKHQHQECRKAPEAQ